MNRIKYYRKQLGLTIRQLSEKSEVAIGYVSTLENDKKGKKNSSKEVMLKIACALEKTVPEVFFPGGKESK